MKRRELFKSILGTAALSQIVKADVPAKGEPVNLPISLDTKIAVVVKRSRPVKHITFEDLDYIPLGWQKRFHDALGRVPYRGLEGTRGSGKTCALLHEAVRLAYENPGTTGLIGATEPLLYGRYGLIAKFAMIVDQLENNYTFSVSKDEMYLKDCGSTIMFRSMDDAERLRGMCDLAWFAVDELQWCTLDAFWMLVPSIRKYPKRSVIAAWNVPLDGGMDAPEMLWIKKLFDVMKSEVFRSAGSRIPNIPAGYRIELEKNLS